MKVRTQQNFNRKTYETVFGISIMPDGGRRYCKYPIGHQEYKDYTQAYQAMKDVQKILDNGGRLVYSPKGSAGINKHEYVKSFSGGKDSQACLIQAFKQYGGGI